MRADRFKIVLDYAKFRGSSLFIVMKGGNTQGDE